MISPVIRINPNSARARQASLELGIRFLSSLSLAEALNYRARAKVNREVWAPCKKNEGQSSSRRGWGGGVGRNANSSGEIKVLTSDLALGRV